MKKNIVHLLRKNGYKVRCIHKRYLMEGEEADGNKLVSRKDIHKLFWHNVDAKGGLSIVEITTPDGQNADGEAACNKIDSFNRKIGLSIALGRAMKKLGIEVDKISVRV